VSVSRRLNLFIDALLPRSAAWPTVPRNGILSLALAIAVTVASLTPLQSSLAQPSYMVSLQTLQHQTAPRFPVRYPIAGLLDVDVQIPRLGLSPAHNRVHAQMVVEASGPALRIRRTGTFDVDFALRYEPSNQTIRAYRLAFHSLRYLDLQAQALVVLIAYGPAIANEA
jgi:hypothetical protein